MTFIVSVSFCAMFFCLRMLRTDDMTSRARSKRASVRASAVSTIRGCLATTIDSPAARGARSCHISSVTKGMNGCSRRSSSSKKCFVAAIVSASMGDW